MSGKTKEEIAFELVAKLKGVGVWGENNRAEILDMYAECLEATSGLRSVGGKKPAALQLAGQSAAPASAPANRPAEPVLAVRQSAPMQAPVPPQQPPVQQAMPQSPQLRQPQQVAQPAYQQQRPG